MRARGAFIKAFPKTGKRLVRVPAMTEYRQQERNDYLSVL
jgi:hypothetical protein